MSAAVIFLFIAMVLAPCFVALWGRVHPEADESSSEFAALQRDSIVPEQAPSPAPATLPTRPVLDRFRELARKTIGSPKPLIENASESIAAPIVQPGLTLEELLAQAVEAARVAKAAAMRADAAASDVAARLAAARVEAATEAALLSRRVASEAAEAAVAAQQAYDAMVARQADEAGREIRLVPDRRAA